MIRNLVFKAARLFWVLPALVLWASFPPAAERTDIFFAFAPLLWFARNREPGRSAKLWFLNGLVYWTATLSWMPAIVKNGGPWPLVLLGWFALAAYCAVYFGAFGWLSSAFWGWTKGRGYAWRLVAILVFEPVLWAGLELVRSRLFGGFSWNQAGVVLANSGFGAPAALGGVYLLSAVAILVNGTVASVAERVMDGRRPGATRFSRFGRSVETLLPLALTWGIYAAAGAEARARAAASAGRPVREISAALVQRNFPCAFAQRSEDPLGAYETLFRSVRASKPDLVVLAESALAEFGAIGSPAAGAFARFALGATGAKAILAGGGRADGEMRLYNSAALYSADAGGLAAPQVCDKVHLVPFGEFIPGDKTFTALQKLAPVGSCWPGTPKLLDFDGVKLAVAICFEDTDAALVREYARMGADALVFITNDSWFSDSAEAVQHSWQAVARAVETGLWVLRTGNSGASGAITPSGRAVWLSSRGGRPLVDAPGTMAVRAGCRPGGSPAVRTPYTALGDAPLFFAFSLLICAAILVKYWTRYERTRRSVSVQFGQDL